jgi:hypothetical protein
MRLLTASLILTFLASALAADDAPILYDRPRQLGRMTNPDITESSGLAWSWENENILWTHNDSGGKPRIFAFNLDGTHKGEYMIDAKQNDWEDMCVFRTERDSYMLIADVGDNEAKRKSSTLYLLREPTLKGKFGKVETLSPDMTIEFTYDAGPHNCEAVAVDASNPKAPKVVLVSKSEGGTCKVFELPLPGRRDKGPFVAKQVATLTVPAITGMAISPDARRAILVTRGDAYEYTRGEKQTWADAFAGKPRVLEMPLRKQGETICYGADGITLYLTSEGSPAPLWMVAPRKEQ